MAITSRELAEGIAEMRSKRPNPEDWTPNDIGLAVLWSEALRLLAHRDDSWSKEARCEFAEHDRKIRELMRDHGVALENEGPLREALHMAFLIDVAWKQRLGSILRGGLAGKRDIEKAERQCLRLISMLKSPGAMNRLRIAHAHLSGQSLVSDPPTSFVSAASDPPHPMQLLSILETSAGLLHTATFDARNQLARFDSIHEVRLRLLSYWSSVERRHISNAKESQTVKFLIDCFNLIGIEKTEKQIAYFDVEEVSAQLKKQSSRHDAQSQARASHSGVIN